MTALQVVTHSGGFHADDVLAWALVRTFYAPDAELVRSREPEVVAAAELAFDVGGEYDPDRLRFDHHQPSYSGPLSSAGMVLAWLEDTGRVESGLAAALRTALVDYVDAVDNGRRTPPADVPDFATLVEIINSGCQTPQELDHGFHQASEMARLLVERIKLGYEEHKLAEAMVRDAMDEALETGSRVLMLDAFLRWKPVYFANGGESHPTDFVLFPGTERDWRVVAIPPEEHSFAQRRSLPESWAGLRDEALEAVTGVPGSVFCHKNRFIAVFRTRDGALTALERAGLLG